MYCQFLSAPASKGTAKDWDHRTNNALVQICASRVNAESDGIKDVSDRVTAALEAGMTFGPNSNYPTPNSMAKKNGDRVALIQPTLLTAFRQAMFQAVYDTIERVSGLAVAEAVFGPGSTLRWQKALLPRSLTSCRHQPPSKPLHPWMMGRAARGVRRGRCCHPLQAFQFHST